MTPRDEWNGRNIPPLIYLLMLDVLDAHAIPVVARDFTMTKLNSILESLNFRYKRQNIKSYKYCPSNKIDQYAII